MGPQAFVSTCVSRRVRGRCREGVSSGSACAVFRVERIALRFEKAFGRRVAQVPSRRKAVRIQQLVPGTSGTSVCPPCRGPSGRSGTPACLRASSRARPPPPRRPASPRWSPRAAPSPTARTPTSAPRRDARRRTWWRGGPGRAPKATVIECALGLARVRYDDAVRTPGTRTCGSQARGGLCVTRDVISFRFACGDIFFSSSRFAASRFARRSSPPGVGSGKCRDSSFAGWYIFFLQRGP